MVDITSFQAAQIINVSRMTVHRRHKDGKLKGRSVGTGHYLYIDLDDLRAFAQTYGYRFNEELAKKFSEVQQQ